jgi:hypothetical protein
MNSNPNVPFASDFQSVVNYLLNFAPSKKRPDKKILAAEMELKSDTVQRHCNGTIRSDADFARDLIRAVSISSPDMALELIAFFLPEGFRVVRDEDIKSESHEAKLTDLSILVGKVQEQTTAAYKDNRITRAEHRDICRLACELKRKATEVEEKVKGDIQ